MSKRFVCFTCGEEFGNRHPATKVECPNCKAKPGSPCKRPSEHTLPGGDVHVEREQLAVDRGVMGMCPKGPTAMGLKKKPAATAVQESLFGD